MNRYALLRFERGLTIKEVAAGSGLHRSTVAAVEESEDRPSSPTAKALADFYGMTVADFLGIEREAA